MNRLFDTALDRTLVPGYTWIGYRLRRRGWAPDDPRPGALRGRRALVTGASSGLGKQTALELARLGATVHLRVRNEVKGRAALDEVARAVPGADLHLELCDVSDLSAVRAFAADLTGRVPGLDVLVHNAGVLPPERQESPDGHEVTLATHVLGPLLLTELLRGPLAAAHGRVIWVSSGGMYAQRLPADDPEYTRGDYSGTKAYARTKRVQVALLPLLQQRWGPDGITVAAMHPGWANTPGVTESLPVFDKVMKPLLRDAHQGADTVVWLAATEPAPPGGRFWHDRAPRATHYVRATRETEQERQRVWEYCRDAAGLDR
ncbi:MAG: SDR family NAD(P)-dependent oxidoreductase [Nocardioidaceae bacterium]